MLFSLVAFLLKFREGRLRVAILNKARKYRRDNLFHQWLFFPFLVFPVDSMKIVSDSSIQSEKLRVDNGQDLLGLENVRKGLNPNGTTRRDPK